MYLQKESVLKFVPKKVYFRGQFSCETTKEMTHVAWQCGLQHENVASDLHAFVLHQNLSSWRLTTCYR